MSYIDAETSRAGARPIEVYKFIGSFATYRYTSEALDVTVAGEAYEAIPIKREAVSAATQDDEQVTLQIELPFDTPVVRAYAFTSSPPSLELEIRRTHWGLDLSSDVVLIWKGPISSVSIENQFAKLGSTGLFSGALAQPIPPRFYQKPCNHVVYDTRCGINPASFTASTTVVSIDASQRGIQVVSDGFADGVLSAGEMINSRTGERRLIVSNVANLVTVNFPFSDILVGDGLSLRAGCDHSLATCKARFNNVINFGGHPYIPDDNPFQGEI